MLSLINRQGMRITVSPLGATWTSCILPLADGPREVLLGSHDVATMLAGGSYLGASVGRYAGRIAGARFAGHSLAANQPPHILHGGPQGFSRRRWEVISAGAPGAGNQHQQLQSPDGDQTLYPQSPDGGRTLRPQSPDRNPTLCLHPQSPAGNQTLRLHPQSPDGDQILHLRLHSPDGDQGFPGNLDAEVIYRLDDDNSLTITYLARTDAPTPCNLTSHAYFNLNGGDGDDGLNQWLRIDASHYQPVGADGIPDAPPRAVDVSPPAFDFREGKWLQRDFLQDAEQQKVRGYDHSFLLAHAEAHHGLLHGERSRSAQHPTHHAPPCHAQPGDERPDPPTPGRVQLHVEPPLRLAAELRSADGRVRMTLATNQPALHLYTGQYLAGTPKRDGHSTYASLAGIALESQYPPDSPGHGEAILQPGTLYRHMIRLTFDFR